MLKRINASSTLCLSYLHGRIRFFSLARVAPTQLTYFSSDPSRPELFITAGTILFYWSDHWYDHLFFEFLFECCYLQVRREEAAWDEGAVGVAPPPPMYLPPRPTHHHLCTRAVWGPRNHSPSCGSADHLVATTSPRAVDSILWQLSCSFREWTIQTAPCFRVEGSALVN